MFNIRFCGMGLFQTDSPWIHPNKTENTYEIIYVTCGQVHLFEEDRHFTLNEGDLVVLKPRVLHGGIKESSGRTSFYWLHFSGEYPSEYCGIIRDFWSGGLFREVIHYDNLSPRDDDAVAIVTAHILLYIRTAFQSVGKNKIASEVYEWLRINIRAGLDNRDVSAHFFLNSEYLSRIIRREYGISLKKLIDKMLMDKFESLLLNTNDSIKEIAAALGFGDDLSACSHFFKYHKNISPGAFRRQFSEIHMNQK